MDNQTRLRAHLARLDWTYAELAAWLTALGEPVTNRQVANWLASPNAANHRACPAWPSLLLERDRPEPVIPDS